MKPGSLDWPALIHGTLSYEEEVAADGAALEKIARGFASHYEVEWRSPDSFVFARGEGYMAFRRFDPFAYVDRGEATRLRAAADTNVLAFPAVATIRFSLRIRVVLAFYAFALIALWMLFGGREGLLPWVAAFLAVYAAHAAFVIASLRRKLAHWLAVRSWN